MDKLLLASKSPRRIEILKKYRDDLLTKSPSVVESVTTKLKPEELVMAIALKKAVSIIQNGYYQNTIILAADTVVYCDRIIGKPLGREDAYYILKSLSAKTHKVFTGFAILHSNINKSLIDFEVTDVLFEDLSDEMIESYLNTNEYTDKAGAYGIQGYGELLVNSINGSYPNVMGLPISKINKHLWDLYRFNLLN
ncbi:MAG: Maf-like protein [Clostridiales bacterium 38_11]|nr:MAG: Maf-like protein [Clostridiales bacterium 38_11]HBH13045.1 septum formation protein Maf [Clostridiales bacterium]